MTVIHFHFRDEMYLCNHTTIEINYNKGNQSNRSGVPIFWHSFAIQEVIEKSNDKTKSWQKRM